MKCLAFIVVLAALPASAKDPEPAPDIPPTVYRGEYVDIDVSGLKEGDWSEYETADTNAAPKAKKPTMRLACVKVEPELAWVELTRGNDSELREGRVLVLALRKTDSQVAQAFYGKPGEAAQTLKVVEGGARGEMPSAIPAVVEGSGKTSKEKFKAGTLSLDCEKIETDLTTTTGCCANRRRTAYLVSEKVAFAPRFPEGAGITWESKPTGKAGLVRRVIDIEGHKIIMTLLRFGTDAKQTLSVK